MRVKIIYLITDLITGGAQRALYQLVAHLDDSRFEVTAVVCLYPTEHSGGQLMMAERIRSLDIPVVDLGMKPKWRVDALAKLYRLLRQEQPVILHCWMFHANLLGRLIGRMARVPLIITGRRNVKIGSQSRERLKRWTRHWDDHITAVCETARQAEIEHTAVLPEKVTTIYNGIELAQFHPTNSVAAQTLRHSLELPSDARLVGTVCRLHPQKGLAHLLHAVPQVLAHIPTAHFLIAGTGELRAELEAQTQQLGITNQVHFLGERRDVPDLLAGLDLFVLPSLWEGMPNVVLEAMAVGLPVVATAVDGTLEIVKQHETGLLVPPADEQALADAIIALLSDSTRAKSMGDAGRQRIETHFSLTTTVQQTEALYDRLLLERLNLRYEQQKGWLST